MDARFILVEALGKVLAISAQELATWVAQEWREAHRVRRGATLRPGGETPLWNALAAAVEPRLRARGAKAALARELGLHRGRISEFFRGGSAMPDAERTLRLLLWLARRDAVGQSGPRVRRRSS